MQDEIIKKSLEVIYRLENEDLTIKDCLIELYENIAEYSIRPKREKHYKAFGGYLPEVDPKYITAAALMIEDVCQLVFKKLAEDLKIWKKTEKLLKSDEQVVVATIVDLLSPNFGLPPICMVTGLLIKIRNKKSFRDR